FRLLLLIPARDYDRRAQAHALHEDVHLLVGVGLEGRRLEVRAVLRLLGDEPRHVVTGGDDLVVVGIVRPRKVHGAPAGAEVGAVTARLHVHAGAANPRGHVGGKDLAPATAAEYRAHGSGNEPQQPLFLVALDDDLAA